MWYLRFSRIILVIFVVSSISANEAVVDYRHESMEAIELHFDAIDELLFGDLSGESFAKDHLENHTSALFDYAKMMPDLFVEGSEGGETLARVWKEPEKFQEALDAFKDSTEELSKAAAASSEEVNWKGDVINGFKGVAATCKGCHQRYRE